MSIFANILYSLSLHDIDTIIVNAKVVIKNGKFFNIDFDDVIEEAKRVQGNLIVKKETVRYKLSEVI